jgi:uncharacterized protein (DUF1778 family)
MENVAVGRPRKNPVDPSRKPVAVTIKGTPKWRAWLEEAAAHSRISVSSFLDLAAAHFAKHQGFTKKPPER